MKKILSVLISTAFCFAAAPPKNSFAQHGSLRPIAPCKQAKKIQALYQESHQALLAFYKARENHFTEEHYEKLRNQEEGQTSPLTFDQEDIEKAQQLSDPLLQAARQNCPGNTGFLVEVLYTVSGLYEIQGRSEEAFALQREAQCISVMALNPEAPLKTHFC